MTITLASLIAFATAAWAATPEGVSPGAVDRIVTVRGECPTFSWGAVAGAAFYELVVFELPSGDDPAGELELTVEHEVLYTRVVGNATAWTPGLERCFIPGGSYVWFVRAVFDEYGISETGDWSQGLYFSVAASPSAQEVEHALEVLRRYVGETGSDADLIEGAMPDGRISGRAAQRRGAARAPMVPKNGERSVLTGPAAIRGEMPDPAGETYGLVGVSNSPDGAGMGVANTVGGADLVLDGSAQGLADTELNESGIDRPSSVAQTFDITNSDVGDMTLRVDGVDVVTTLTDQDTPPRDPGNQLSLSGNALDVVEGPGSGLDADALDGLDSTAFSPLAHSHDDRYFTETELSTSGADGAVHWDNLTSVPAGFADGVDNDTTYTFGPGLMIDNGQVVIDPAALSPQISALDSTELPYTSVAIGSDGLGLISYYDSAARDLKVAHCDDIPCTSATISTLDSAGTVGQYTSVAIGADGLGLISYYDATNDDLKVAHCDNVACSSATLTALDLWTDVGKFTSVAIGADGLGLISYYDSTADNLKVAHCQNVVCTGATLSTLDASTADEGRHTSVAIGSDGLGLISYCDSTIQMLKVAHCDNTVCTSAAVSYLGVGCSERASVAIGSDGLGLISSFDPVDTALKVAHCDNVPCTSATVSTPDSRGRVGGFSSVTIGSDGLGLISYCAGDPNFDLKVARCHDISCTITTLSTVDSGLDVGWFTSVAIGSDGRGLVSYGGNNQLRVAHLPIVY